MSTLLLLPLLLAPSPAATDVTLGLTLEAHEVRTGAPLALTVTVDNPTGDLLVGVDVGLELRDAAGLVVTDWTLGVPVVTGMAALDGSASLGPGASASGDNGLVHLRLDEPLTAVLDGREARGAVVQARADV